MVDLTGNRLAGRDKGVSKLTSGPNDLPYYQLFFIVNGLLHELS